MNKLNDTSHISRSLWSVILLSSVSFAQAPPITDHIDSPPKQTSVYSSLSPVDLNDGINVGSLSIAGADLAIQKFVEKVENNVYGPLASILIWHRGELVYELYANHGYENAPHFLRSVTKTITSLIFARAIELGYLTMDNIHQPVLDFFPDIDRTNIHPEAAAVTLYEVLLMKSGFRGIKEWMKEDDLKGYRIIQKYFELTKIPLNKEYSYAATDCMIIMALVDELTTRRPASSLRQYASVWAFIQEEFLAKFAITNYKWGTASNGNPSSAAGCFLRSRDLLKIGIALHQKGVYNGEQLFSHAFTEQFYNRAPLKGYIFFTEGIRHNVGGIEVMGVGGRGAAGQFITSYRDLDLVIAATSDNRGQGGFVLDHARKAHVDNLLPIFAKKEVLQEDITPAQR